MTWHRISSWDVLELQNRESPFDGETIEPEADDKRLASQGARLFDLMSDGKWRTLTAIQAVGGGSEAGVSARLRDGRKSRFGGHTLNRMALAPRGLFAYQLVAVGPNPFTASSALRAHARNATSTEPS